MNKEIVNIKLMKDEALVLFEFLVRFNEKKYEKVFENQAEQRVLWNIEASLERLLAEPFSTDYSEIIKKARETIRDKDE